MAIIEIFLSLLKPIVFHLIRFLVLLFANRDCKHCAHFIPATTFCKAAKYSACTAVPWFKYFKRERWLNV